MAKKITNSTSSFGFNVPVAKPLDDRTQFLTLYDLLDYTIGGGFTSIYDGLEVTVDDMRAKFRWTESTVGMFNIYNGFGAGYDAPVTYPDSWPVATEIDYSGKTYNWVLIDPTVTYSLSVNAGVIVDSSPMTANENGIYVRAAWLPEKVLQHEMATVVVKERSGTELEFPHEVRYTRGEYIHIVAKPMWPVNSALIIKIT
ncbi:MAG: hypothetical protein KAH32_05155 [Chlamydiia bacterium]|nr:hypothetical protein [Chlamydiia bacterium]